MMESLTGLSEGTMCPPLRAMAFINWLSLSMSVAVENVSEEGLVVEVV